MGRACAVWLTAALLAVSVPARAGIVVMPLVPLGPMPGYYMAGGLLPEHLRVNQQYYDLSLGGVEQLCASQPDLCAAPEQQRLLSHLEAQQRTGLILIVTGVAAAIAGTTWTIVAFQDDDASAASRIPMAVGLGAGIALPLAGALVLPSRDDLVRFVNMANLAHPASPIELHLGRLAPGGVGGPLGAMGAALALRL